MGMVGSAIVKKLKSENYKNLITINRSDLDLTDQKSVFNFLKNKKPDLVIIAAAKVGGILSNDTYRGEFIYENLSIELNLIHGSHLANINNLIFLGSSCIYPRNCPQPIKEEYLLTGALENTNEPYAIAKIAGLKLCESYYNQYKRNYFSVMPTNLYGENDNYDLANCHVLPALLKKLRLAHLMNQAEWSLLQAEIEKFPIGKINKNSDVDLIKEELSDYGIFYSEEKSYIELWGDGTPKREFLHVQDLADAIFFLIESIKVKSIYDNGFSHINIGSGEELSIKELSTLIKEIVNYEGEIRWDKEKPNGTPRKVLDSKFINDLGWQSKIKLYDGIENLQKILIK